MRLKSIDILTKAWYNIDTMDSNNQMKYYEEEICIKKREDFENFRVFLLEYNEKYNLTTITDEQDMYYKHFLDSVVGEKYIKKGARVAEIGSGAGFPSIPLKLFRPDLQFDLFESVGKKCEFLRAVVDKFQLENVHIYNIRAEDAAREIKHRDCYDVAVARAVARMNTLSEYCLPFVKVGGVFLAYKSGDTSEIIEADSAYKVLGAKRKQVITYELPKDYGARSLAVIEKVKPTPNKYPRGQGKERKNPL